MPFDTKKLDTYYDEIASTVNSKKKLKFTQICFIDINNDCKTMAIQDTLEGKYYACYIGDIEMCQKKFNNHNCDKYGMIHAAAGGNLELVKWFVSLGVNEYCEALRYACLSDNIYLVDYLAELTKKSDQRWTHFGIINECIAQAAKANQVELVDYLIGLARQKVQWGRPGSDTEYKIFWFEPLRQASMYGHGELAQHLVQLATEDKYEDPWGTVIYWASYGGHRELAQFAIHEKALICAIDWDSGLWGAAAGGDLDAVYFFIKNGATLLDRAKDLAQQNCQMHCVEFIKKIKANNN